ncbi:MAG: membrane protein insertion efficiency factor YidD [Pirellulales bacterium]
MKSSNSLLTRCARAVDQILVLVLTGCIHIYKLTLSPVLGRHCRFQPTCSTYFQQALKKYGAVKGSWRGVCRICRCHPWNKGGYDPP